MNRKNNQENFFTSNYGSNVNSNYNNTVLLNKMFEEGIHEEDYNEEMRKKQIISQLELNETIIKERNEEIEQIYKEVLVINDIFKDLNKLVAEQTEPIYKIEEQIDKTLKQTENGVENLKKAEKYYSSWLSRRNKLILLSIAGLTINVPITLTFGLKAGVISGISTIGISAITSLFNK